VKPDCFWVNPFGRAFSLITKSDLILVDHSGKVIDGGENRLLNTAAYMIHAAIHEARPDVMCAAHSHSIYGRTWCSLGRKLDTLTQDSCAFHDDHVLYESFNGVVLAEKEGKDIAACLGGKKAALLQNHGLLTVGGSVEEVRVARWFVFLSKIAFADYDSRPSSGSFPWRSAARASLWLRLRLVRVVKSQLQLVQMRLRTLTALLGQTRPDGSVRSRCLM
jgi:ribulose-5-phosphate 4-epimerase/fuculose-1-phosphate aldolase